MIEDVKSKNIWQHKITANKFLEDIDVIKSVSHANIFSNNGFEEIIDDLNQIHSYDPDYRVIRPELTGGYAFIDDLHRLANLIREASELPNIDKLFKANIFSHVGMFLQFQLTVYVSRHLEITDVEAKNKPINSDIICRFEEHNLHFSVKDCREEIKDNKNHDTVSVIDGYFADIGRSERAENFLAVKSMDNSPPAAVDESFWLGYVSKLKLEPQVCKVVFNPNDWPTINKEVTVTIEFEWREWNSTHLSPLAGITNETKVATLFNKWEQDVIAHGQKDAVYIMAVITDDEYDWKEMEESLDDSAIGLLMVCLSGYYIQHSNIMLPPKLQSLSAELQKCIPAQTYWRHGVMKKI